MQQHFLLCRGFLSLEQSTSDRLTSCGFNRRIDEERRLESIPPAPRAPKVAVALQQLAIPIVELQRPLGPADVLTMRVLIPLRDLIDDVEDLCGPGVGDVEHRPPRSTRVVAATA